MLLFIFVFLTTLQPIPHFNDGVFGFVYDAKDNEPLPGAVVRVKNQALGVVTQANGQFQLQKVQSKDTLIISFIGYRISTVALDTVKSNPIIILLDRIGLDLEEAIISERRWSLSQMSVTQINRVQLDRVPSFFGQQDILKTMQLMPGVQPGNDGTAGVNVRGGNADQTLVMIDGVPLYNPYHAGGFVSIFHPTFINKVDFYSAAIPTKYGGRLSSVIDLQTRIGNNSKYTLEAGAGITTADFAVDGPIKIGQSGTFILGGRLSTINEFMNRMELDKQNIIPETSFNDLFGKVHYDLREYGQLSIMAYTSIDIRNQESTRISRYFESPQNPVVSETVTTVDLQNLNWHSSIIVLNWNKMLNSYASISAKVYSNSYKLRSEEGFRSTSKASNSTSNESRYSSIRFQNRINDYAAQLSYGIFVSKQVEFNFGIENIYHDISGLTFDFNDIRNNTPLFDVGSEYLQTRFFEHLIFINQKYKAEKFELQTGLRITSLPSTGTYKPYFEPRISLGYSITPNISLQASYNKTLQNAHQLPSRNFGVNNELWFHSTTSLAPQMADIYAIGSHIAFGGGYSLNLESYYKDFFNLTEFAEGAFSASSISELDLFLTQGSGQSYGHELSLKKDSGRLTGWINASWSRSWRTFAELNQGERFPFKFDRVYNLNATTSYAFSDKLFLNTMFLYMGGIRLTVPLYNSNDSPSSNLFPFRSQFDYPIYSSRNLVQLPDYHRLDVSLEYKWTMKKSSHSLSAGAFNIYHRFNPAFAKPADTGDPNPEYIRLRMFYLFGLVPFINYKILL